MTPETSPLRLEIPCGRCNGQGWVLDIRPPEPGTDDELPKGVWCGVCNGSGRRPSSEGVRLLLFLERYWGTDWRPE